MKEPIILADGTQVYEFEEVEPETTTQSMVEVPRHDEAVAEVTYKRRRLADLPVPKENMNFLSVVLSYHMLGISNRDISIVLGVSEKRIEAVLLTDAFINLQKELTKQLLERDGDQIRTMFVQGAKKAASVVTDLLDSNDDGIALSAAKDLLDRGGHRPADIVEHRHRVEGGLTINFIQKKNENKIIDAADFEVIDNGQSS